MKRKSGYLLAVASFATAPGQMQDALDTAVLKTECPAAKTTGQTYGDGGLVKDLPTSLLAVPG